MLDVRQVLAEELTLPKWQIDNALKLFSEGGTVPFVSRYRKEQTGGMDEVQLRTLLERHGYLAELEDRKAVILESIEEQGELTDDLRARIEATRQKAELEDLYLPYRPKRRTRGTAARERGLEPLAAWIRTQNERGTRGVDLDAEAARYVNGERDVATLRDALQGASDILAEEVAETAAYRAWIRDYMLERGVFISKIKRKHAKGTTQFETYRDFRAPVKQIAAHQMLALRRGESEGVLTLKLIFDEEHVLGTLARREIRTGDTALSAFLTAMLADAFGRLMKNALAGDVRAQKKHEADAASVETFASNLRELLLAAPAGMRPTLGIDPGYRTGCKLAVLDETGRFIEHATIFPFESERQQRDASSALRTLVARHDIELVAVGNGTAGRETEQFATKVLQETEDSPACVLVSEAGASVYSASEVAIAEFPDLDVTVRGAISIGRRLQDPLAELVKIDPKSIGVGQYQHDVDQSMLKQKLDETVESCVNFVGVDLNMASRELLGFVAGITASVAENIVAHRNDRGAFARRKDLLDVSRFGPKTFEQAAGFLRIRGGDNPLDQTGVHPESYPVVERMARDLGVAPEDITGVPERLKRLDLKRYTTGGTGLPTLQDIVSELEKPGRDPREAFRYAHFRKDVTNVSDLEEGMVLEGVVTNVTDFGAFVDLGVKRDGLVHISQLADRFVRDPSEVVKVAQVVTVRVTNIDEKLNRIGLSMRLKEEG
jgi:uncharacterized protein